VKISPGIALDPLSVLCYFIVKINPGIVLNPYHICSEIVGGRSTGMLYLGDPLKFALYLGGTLFWGDLSNHSGFI